MDLPMHFLFSCALPHGFGGSQPLCCCPALTACASVRESLLMAVMLAYESAPIDADGDGSPESMTGEYADESTARIKRIAAPDDHPGKVAGKDSK